VGPRIHLPPDSSEHGRSSGWAARVCYFGVNSRPGDFAVGPRRIWIAYRVLHSARSGRDLGALCLGETARIAERPNRLDLHADRDCQSGLLALSSAVREACHTPIYARDPCLMSASATERFLTLASWLAVA